MRLSNNGGVKEGLKERKETRKGGGDEREKAGQLEGSVRKEIL